MNIGGQAMNRRARILSIGVALILGALSAGAVQAGGPERISESYTDTFFDDFILELCGIETFTTVTERWTLKTFPDGSQQSHVNRLFVPEDTRIPIERGAGTSFFAPDGSRVTVGSLTRIFDRDGGLRLVDGGLVKFDPSGDPQEMHGHVVSLGVDLAPYYCP
jgi:hypothetical protein